MQNSFLIVVDAHSKWPEIIPTKPTNSTATIKILREIFPHFGLPSILVSDNGSNFRSTKFDDILKANEIHHNTQHRITQLRTAKQNVSFKL
jgi:DNA polymerase III epsilon subunit-like protein